MRKLPVLVLVCLAAAARAGDTVDLEITGRARVEGTLRPTDERENFLFAGLRGAKVKVTGKSREDDGATPSIVLVDAADTVVGTGTPTSSGGKISVDALGGTEGHRVRVTTASGDGDYRLDLEMKPRLRWSETGQLDAGEEGMFAFAAPAGSVASIDLKAPRGSEFRPLLLELTPPVGLGQVFDAPDEGALRHVVRKVPIDGAGEHFVLFRNAGAATGAWTISVTLTARRPARSSVDITDAVLDGDGTQAVFGRFAGTTAATFLDPGSLLDASTLDGLSILIPAGALPFPASIRITENDEFLASDDLHTASATVRFEPSGLEFTTPAAITLPYDPDAFDDAASELAIVVQSEDGSQETIQATSVNTGNETATFPATHFSLFQAISPRARPLRGRYVELELLGRVGAGHGSELTVARNEVVVGKGPRAFGPMMRTVARRSAGFGLDPQQTPRLLASLDERAASGTAEIVDDTTVVLRSAQLGDVSLRRGRLADVLTGTEQVDDEVRFHALLRRSLALPARGNLAGRWHACAFTFSGIDLGDGTLGIRAAADEFELEVARSGKAQPSAPRHREIVQTFPAQEYDFRKSGKGPRPARLEPAGEEARLTIQLPGDLQDTQILMAPVLRGDALVGVSGSAAGGPGAVTAAQVRYVVLVRAATDERRAELPIRALLDAFTVFAEQHPNPPARLGFAVTRGAFDFVPPGTATVNSVVTRVLHTAAGLPQSDSGTAGATSAISPAADGTVSSGLFLTPRRGVLVLFSPDRGVFPFGIAFPGRPPQ